MGVIGKIIDNVIYLLVTWVCYLLQSRFHI